MAAPLLARCEHFPPSGRRHACAVPGCASARPAVMMRPVEGMRADEMVWQPRSSVRLQRDILERASSLSTSFTERACTPHSRTARPHSVGSNKASGRRRTGASRAGCTPSTSCCLPRSSPAAAAARARAAWTPAPGLRRQRVQLRSVLIHSPTFITCQALVNTSEHCHTVNQAMVPHVHTTSSGATQPDQRKPPARSSCCILGAQHSRVAKLRAVLHTDHCAQAKHANL
jgi:hypothetical protein